MVTTGAVSEAASRLTPVLTPVPGLIDHNKICCGHTKQHQAAPQPSQRRPEHGPSVTVTSRRSGRLSNSATTAQRHQRRIVIDDGDRHRRGVGVVERRVGGGDDVGDHQGAARPPGLSDVVRCCRSPSTVRGSFQLPVW